jgi:hypothetical protein
MPRPYGSPDSITYRTQIGYRNKKRGTQNRSWHWACVIKEIRATLSFEIYGKKIMLMRKIAILWLGALLAIVEGCSRPPTGPEAAHIAWLNTVPSPGDSIIIESKTLNVSTGAPAAVVRVFITNRDTLANLTLALVERSRSGGAYMTLSYPRNFNGVVTPLTGTLQFSYFLISNIFNGNGYNSTSPDTFAVAMFYDPRDIATTAEPPNWTRKAFLEIKFDTVSAGPAGGTVEFEPTAIRTGGGSYLYPGFVDLSPEDIKPNFLKGTINILAPDSSSVFSDRHKGNESP